MTFILKALGSGCYTKGLGGQNVFVKHECPDGNDDHIRHTHKCKSPGTKDLDNGFSP